MVNERDGVATQMAGDGLVCSSLVKSFAGVTVLKSVDFTVRRGSVVGLIGENGAGKSTLSAIIAGNIRPDSGSMVMDGRPYAPAGPADALRLGVVLIHQEIRLLRSLSVAENIFLGRLPLNAGRIDRTRMYGESTKVLRLLGVDIDPDSRVESLSTAEQQEVEIAKALARNPQYIVFDEPSASLGESETERILERIRALRQQGAGVVYISHRLDEVRAVADSIVCLRDGERTAAWDTGDVAKATLVSAMVGREFTFKHMAPPPRQDKVVLEVRQLGRSGVFDGINFDVAEGEVFGLAGLIGSGRSEVVRAIAGVDPVDTGSVVVAGREVNLRSPRSAIDAGIVMVPEDRKLQGLNLGRPAGDNITLPWEPALARFGCITRRMVDAVAREKARAFDIRGRMDLPVIAMSGGNQQKVLLAKWLVKAPKIFIADEPTRGVDVGAKMAIYEILRKLAGEGVGVLLVSSELEEVLGLSHRILVMSGGRQEGILDREDATPEKVMAMAFRHVPTHDSVMEPELSGRGSC